MYLPLRSPSGRRRRAQRRRPRRRARRTSAADARLAASLANLVGVFLERQRLQAAATRAPRPLREADRLKSSLLSSVSHELKTPLAALTATVSNLLESDVDWDEKSVRDELRAIVGDVARLNNSIGALLDLSRLEAHAWEPRRELYELARHRRRRPRRAAGRTERARVLIDLPDDLPPVARRLRAVGARSAEPAGERLPLRRRRQPGHASAPRPRRTACRIWVEDEGPGIPADEHEAVFEKFYRGRGTGIKAPSGTGLGLAITREIVRAHGGTIHVEDVHAARRAVRDRAADAGCGGPAQRRRGHEHPGAADAHSRGRRRGADPPRADSRSCGSRGYVLSPRVDGAKRP